MAAKRGAEPTPEETKPKRRPTKVTENEILKQFTVAVRGSHGDVAKLLADTARQLLSADRASVWVVDEERGLLVTRMQEGLVTCKMQEGIVGRVYRTKTSANISDPYRDEDFNSNVDVHTGFVTQNILCVPVMSPTMEVIAVVQVLNKIEKESQGGVCKKAFVEGDETNLVILAQLSASHLSSKSNHVAGLDQDPTLSTAMALKITDEEKEKVLTPEFDVLKSLSKPGDDLRLVPLAVHLFEHFDLCAKFKIDKETLFRFLLAVRLKYRRSAEVPYHNFVHAWDVMQTACVFLERGSVRSMVKDTDVLALLVSSLLHDVGHTGTNNKHHVDMKTPLGILSTCSTTVSGVLEVHHCHLALDILESEPTAILAGMQDDDRKYVYNSLFDNILATDIAKHGEFLKISTAFAKQKYDKKKLEHRRVAMKMLLKAADISNVTKDFELSRRWGLAVNEEFHSQGDLEKAAGVHPTFDRTDFNGMKMAESQKKFIDFVEPFFAAVTGRFDKLSYALEKLRFNRGQWQKILASSLGVTAAPSPARARKD